MRNALTLAPANRFILRSAARLWVHRDLPDRALHLLRSSEVLAYDPWIVAAEIATSTLVGVTPRSLKKGLEFIAHKRFPPLHLSELASAIATLELEAGSRRKARRLFQFALVEPTENAVAQAELASAIDNGVKINPERLEISSEARAWHAFRFASDWALAVTETINWQRDQLFSKQPAILGSFVAMFCMRDSAKAQDIIDLALLANPYDEVLLNNKVVVLAEQNQVEAAEEVLAALPKSSTHQDNWDAILQATTGLVQFRKGNSEAGRALYERAAELFSAKKNAEQMAIALVACPIEIDSRESYHGACPISCAKPTVGSSSAGRARGCCEPTMRGELGCC